MSVDEAAITIRSIRPSNPLHVPQKTRWTILVDGKKAGELAVGGESTFQLSSGQHSLQLKVGRYFSERLDVRLDNDLPIRLEGGISAGCPKHILPLLGIIFALFAVDFLTGRGSNIQNSFRQGLAAAPANWWHLAIVAAVLVISLILLRIIHRPGSICYLRFATDGLQPDSATAPSSP